MNKLIYASLLAQIAHAAKVVVQDGALNLTNGATISTIMPDMNYELDYRRDYTGQVVYADASHDFCQELDAVATGFSYMGKALVLDAQSNCSRYSLAKSAERSGANVALMITKQLNGTNGTATAEDL